MNTEKSELFKGITPWYSDVNNFEDIVDALINAAWVMGKASCARNIDEEDRRKISDLVARYRDEIRRKINKEV